MNQKSLIDIKMKLIYIVISKMNQFCNLNLYSKKQI
jgi:hypothetical protein